MAAAEEETESLPARLQFPTMSIGHALAAATLAVLIVRCVLAWRYTGQFVDPPREPSASDAVVATRPFDPDRVVHEVGRWEYFKERLELGRGPTALCGYPLYTDGESPTEDPPADAPRCPECAMQSCNPIAS